MSTSDCTTLPRADAGALYRSYAAAVERWALRLARSPADAEDIVQEVFLVAHRRLGAALGNPGPWLFRVTRNVARHLWRDRRRRELVQLDEASELPDARPDPCQSLERRVDLHHLNQALGSLCPQDQRLFLLCDVRRFSAARVTDLTGLKPETVRVRRHRARLRMARWLRQVEPVWGTGS